LKKEFVEKHKYKIIACIIFSIVIIIVCGLIFAPHIFYDQWIWKHYIGPIIADAVGHNVEHNGVVANEGYTLLSEITYGIILVIALYLIYKLLKTLNITIDWHFCLALLPYILFGPISRVLEDTGFFKVPIAYLFISPLIYLLIACYTIVILVLGVYIEKKFSGEKDISFLKSVSPFVFFLIAVNILYLILWLNGSNLFSYSIHPFVLWITSGIAISVLGYEFIKRRKIDHNFVLFSGGLLIILPSAYLVGRWMLGFQWDVSHGIYLNVFLIIVGFALLITFLIYIISHTLRNKENLIPYRGPINLLMVFGHMLDGFTSWISLKDPFGFGLPLYSEKHPIPDFLMGIWGPLYPITKFILIIAIIYLLDVYYKGELKKAPLLVGLLKICIIILGFAPGTRDILRVAMGV
jgi:uncharacterized membrane protein